MSERKIPARTEYTCDRCNRVVQPDVGGHLFAEHMTRNHVMGGKIYRLDLCGSCGFEFERWMTAAKGESHVREGAEGSPTRGD